MSDQHCNTTCKCFREALLDSKPFTYCAALGKPKHEGVPCEIEESLRTEHKMRSILDMMKDTV